MTAVEFLKKKLTSIFVNDKGFNKLFEQAKEMEKQQIKDAFLDGNKLMVNLETYGSKGIDETKVV